LAAGVSGQHPFIYQWPLGFIYHFNRNGGDIDPIWK
jgi:hypothetical protein